MYKGSFRKAAVLLLVLLMTFGMFMLTGCGQSYEHVARPIPLYEQQDRRYNKRKYDKKCK